MEERRRQQEEIEALESIYESQFRRLDDVWRNPRFSITVYPAESQRGADADSYTRIDLVVTYSPRYPAEAPAIAVDNAKGLSREEKAELLEILQRETQQRTASNAGEVFVYDLVQRVESFLREHNRRNISGLDEMRLRQQRAREAAEGVQARKRQMEEELVKESLAEELEEQERIEDERLYLRQQERRARGQHRTSPGGDDNLGMPDLNRSAPDPADSPDDEEVDNLLTSLADRTKSRWETDFKELRFLGSGGFGEVVKARNRLDKYDYAVKKVLASAHECQKILEEVVSLKRLEHPYIVRYYSAWIERGENAAGMALYAGTSSSLAPDHERAGAEEDDEEEEKLEELLDDGPQEFDEPGGWNWMVTPTSLSGHPRRREEDNDSDYSSASSESDDQASTSDAARTLDEDSDLSHADSDIVFDRGLEGGRSQSTRHPSEGDLLHSKPLQLTEESDVQDAGKVGRGDRKRSNKREWCLYIQMEYCTLTLREVIDLNELWKRPRLIWRLARQILEALDHMHKHRCIHRDLKPNNIFLAQNGIGTYDIRIGDFGLATEAVAGKGKDADENPPPTAQTSPRSARHGRPPNEEEDPRRSDATAAAEADDAASASVLGNALLTGGVGTAIYRAPEQERGGDYDAAADMFSCGIVFFEMVAKPFKTGMERVVALTRLREGQLPDELVSRLKQDKDNSVKPIDSSYRSLDLIKAMVQRDPGQRPTAQSLLKPGVIPAAEDIVKDYEKDFGVITHPSNTSYPKLIDSLFRNLLKYSNPNPRLEMQYDRTMATEVGLQGMEVVEEAVLRELVVNRLREIFECHGAVAVDPPFLRPRGLDEHKSSTAWTNSLSASGFARDELTGRGNALVNGVVDCEGALLQLPENLTAPFARMAARTNISNLKRYQFGRVFFKGRRIAEGEAEGAPLEALEADFDILQDAEAVHQASDGRSSSYQLSHVCEAETIIVGLRIMHTFQPYLGNPVLKVNHMKLSAALFELMGLSKSRRQEVRRLLRRGLTVPSKGEDPDVKRAGDGSSDLLRELQAMIHGFGNDRSFDGALASIRSIRAFVDRIPRVQEALSMGIAADAGPVASKELRKVLQLRSSLQRSAKALADALAAVKAVQQFLLDQQKAKADDRVEDPASTPGRGKRHRSRSRRRKEAKRNRGVLDGGPTSAVPVLGKDVRVAVDLTLTSRVYRPGFVFQLQLESDEGADGTPGTPDAEAADTVAEGGRYDSLISNFRRPGYMRLRSLDQSQSVANPHPTLAVGLHFSVDKLCVALGRYLKATERERKGKPFELSSMPPLLPRAAPQVLVASKDGLPTAGLIERMKLSAMLWAVGIRANYLGQSGEDDSQDDPQLLDLIGTRASRSAAQARKEKGFTLPGISAQEDLAGIAQAASAHGVSILVVQMEEAGSCAVCVLDERATSWDTPMGFAHMGVGQRLLFSTCLAAAMDANPLYGPIDDPSPAVSQRVYVRDLPSYILQLFHVLQSSSSGDYRRADFNLSPPLKGSDPPFVYRGEDNPPPAPVTTAMPSTSDASEEHSQAVQGSRRHNLDVEVINAFPRGKDNKKSSLRASRSLRIIRMRAEEMLAMISGSSTGRSDLRIGRVKTVVLVSPLSYLLLRDVGTEIARAYADGQDVSEPEHKKTNAEPIRAIVKTINDVFRSEAARESPSRKPAPLTVLLYSNSDDRFDIVSL